MYSYKRKKKSIQPFECQWFVNYRGYSTGKVCHDRSCNIRWFFIMHVYFLRSQNYYHQLISQIYKNNWNKKKMKEQENEHTIHTNEHEMYPGKPKNGENPTRRWGLCFALLSSIMTMQTQTKGNSLWSVIRHCGPNVYYIILFLPYYDIKSYSWIIYSTMEQVQF